MLEVVQLIDSLLVYHDPSGGVGHHDWQDGHGEDVQAHADDPKGVHPEVIYHCT